MFELKLPYIDPTQFAAALISEYGFAHRHLWNATEIMVPEELGTGSFKLFIRPDVHFFRGKWDFIDQTIFHSNDPVAKKGMLDFRISANGLIQSAALEGHRRFEFDTTHVDGIRIFMYEGFLNGNKHDLQDRFGRYCYDRNIQGVLKEIFEIDPQQQQDTLLLESKMLEFIYYWREFLSNKDIERHFEGVSEHQLRCIYDAVQIIEANLNREVSIRDLSKKVGLNECDFKRSFRKVLGLPLRQFIIKERMETAHDLLIKTELPIAEICEYVGYTNRSHFVALFERFHNESPYLYRKY